MTRVRLLLALERSGIDLEEVAEAVGEGRLSLRFAGQVIAEPVGLTDRTHAEAASDLGLEPDLVRRLQLAFGLPTAPLDDPLREDDLELFALVARAREAGLDEEPLIRALRAFGMSVRQIVEVQRELFREAVEDRLLGEGVVGQEMLDAAAGTRLRLQRLGFRTIFLLLRRFLEQAVFENLVERIETVLEAEDITRSGGEPSRAIVFIDLSGYTRLTEEAGDRRAAEQGARLVAIALERCGASSGGRVVKSLGDGVMLRFADAGEAVRAALDVLERAREAGLPPARAGVAAGPVVQRDGDYFGRTVNLAARLVDAAEPGRVLASAAVARAADGDGGVAFEDAGERALQGIEAPVPVFSARRS